MPRSTCAACRVPTCQAVAKHLHPRGQQVALPAGVHARLPHACSSCGLLQGWQARSCRASSTQQLPIRHPCQRLLLILEEGVLEPCRAEGGCRECEVLKSSSAQRCTPAAAVVNGKTWSCSQSDAD